MLAAEAAGTRGPAQAQAQAGATPGTDGTPGAARIRAAFERARAEHRVALIPYVVAGYPDQATSLEAALAAIDAGADLIEVGLPYSDPLADGMTLQRASAAALAAGGSFAASVELVAAIRSARPGIPIVPMAYVNQILAAGDGSEVLGRLAEAGASGLILADLTPDEGGPLEAIARSSGLALVYLVTPTTPPARRPVVAQRTGGFLYAVSVVGVTGARRDLPGDVQRFVREVRTSSPVPVAVGFGVSRPEQVRRLGRVADGVIVASALVDALGEDGRDVAAMARLVRELAAATALDGEASP
jgi:tryptophan synthase alpha chain